MKRIFGYFFLLTLIVNLTSPQGSLASIPVQFYLKDQLHLSPEQQARYQLIISIPLYLSFIFGLLRDRFAALGVRDKTYFLLIPPVTALIYLVLSQFHRDVWQIGAGMMFATLVYRVLAPAVAALQASVGNSLRVTSRLSAVVKLTGYALGAALAWSGVYLKSHVSHTAIYLMLAVSALCLLFFGLKEPSFVAKGEATSLERHSRDFVADLRRLFGHATIWPAVVIYLLWEFAPTSGTPLLNHLTNTVGLNDAQYADYRFIQTLSFLPGALTYGLLAKHVQPRKLLFWSMVIGVPQMVPYIFIHSAGTAYAAGVWYGMVGGMASAAVLDLLLRSCPAGFEGFTVELGVTGFYVADRIADYFGSIVYEHGGFVATNLFGTAVYALIIPLLAWVPNSVLERREA